MTGKPGLHRKYLLCASAFAALAAVGCAEIDPDGAPRTSSESSAELEADAPELQQQSGTGQRISVPNRDTPYFAEVFANGPGCPPGTAVTSISSDGLVFTTTFSAYELDLSKTKSTLGAKNCNLAIKLVSPSGLSYAVSEFSYIGYVFLGSGGSASLTASYSFMGNRVLPRESSKKDFTGPFDDTYLYKDVIRTEDFNWSPCAQQRDLNVYTRFSVQSPQRQGYVSVGSIDANTRGAVIFKVNTRRCSQ